MTQGIYFVGLDMNRDSYFPRGVTEGDALNLVDNPAQLKTSRIGTDANHPTYTRDFYNTEQSYHWEFTTGTDANAGFYIGQTSDYEYSTWIPNGTQITVTMDFKGITNYTGETLRFTVTARAGTLPATATTDFVLTSSWQTVSLTFTPDSEHLLITIERITTTTDVTYQMRKHFVGVGASAPTGFNTGSASDYYENVTTYVTNMSWNNGLDHYDQQVSSGSRAQIVLDNRDEFFYQEDDFAGNIAPNSNFAFWDNANTPTGWTGTNISADAQTTEVGIGSLHGAGGTGSLNLYATTRVLVSCYQNSLTAYQRYKVTFTIGASSGTGGVRFFIGTSSIIYPVSRSYTLPGTYSFFFTCGSDTTLHICNNRYPCDITIDNVFVYPVPRFAGLGKESLVTIRAYDSSTEYQMWIGRVDRIKPTGGYYGARMVTLDCVDAMQEFGNLEYRPTDVYSGVSVLTELQVMFGQLQLLWPYSKDYWILGINTLGVDTWLFEDTDIVPLYTVQTFLIDYATASASNSEKGINAAAFARDLMALEIGGRFFIDSRSGSFYVLAHDYDSSTTSTTTVTDDQFDDFEMVNAEDVLNTVSIWYKQKRLGLSNIVLWSSQDDIVVEAESTKIITGRYFDPTNELLNVSATSTEPLTRGTDYVVSPTINQHRVIVTVDAGGQSATFTIDNRRQAAITITTLQVRGMPLYALTEESIQVQNADSTIENNVQRRDYNMPLISGSDTAIGIATGLTTLRGEAIDRLQSITFSATKDSTRYTRGTGFGVGVPITIQSTVLNHNQRYIIIGEHHQVTPSSENTHIVTWILKPMKLFNYWILGQSGRSELGETTILMP